MNNSKVKGGSYGTIHLRLLLLSAPQRTRLDFNRIKSFRLIKY